MRSFCLGSTVKRAAICGCAVTVALASFTMTASALQPAKVTIINTFGTWDGTTMVQPFGCPNTTTYGETITVPMGSTSIDRFTVSWQDLSSGSFKVRGEVYAWDPSTFHAIGSATAETKPRRVHSGASGFFKETFKFKDAAVTEGEQYVVFASIDKDYSVCDTSSYLVGWGAIRDDNAYPGGTFVYQNNGRSGGSDNWTTQPWSTNGFDLAFKLCLK
jgi:hypothetical protein